MPYRGEECSRLPSTHFKNAVSKWTAWPSKIALIHFVQRGPGHLQARMVNVRCLNGHTVRSVQPGCIDTTS